MTTKVPKVAAAGLVVTMALAIVMVIGLSGNQTSA